MIWAKQGKPLLQGKFNNYLMEISKSKNNFLKETRAFRNPGLTFSPSRIIHEFLISPFSESLSCNCSNFHQFLSITVTVVIRTTKKGNFAGWAKCDGARTLPVGLYPSNYIFQKRSCNHPYDHYVIIEWPLKDESLSAKSQEYRC